MLEAMRRFLYSRWFFLLLATVCAIDLAADLGEEIWGHNFLNSIAVGMDFIALALSVWIFTDLHVRRPKHGNDTRSRG
jgi:hypothetical protein